MSQEPVLDVAARDDPPFGYHPPRWWGNVLMIIIEATGFAILAAGYFYIRRNFDVWPPARTPLPALGISFVQIAVQLVSVFPYWYAARLAFRHEKPGVVGTWLVAGVLFGVAAIVLRWLEFSALHTRYDANAYGTITYSILFVHLLHLVAGTIQTLLIALALFKGPVEKKHYTDATAMSAYWYFVVSSWIALWLIVFIAPRLMQ